MATYPSLTLASVVFALTACGANTASDTRGAAAPATATTTSAQGATAAAPSAAAPPSVPAVAERPGCAHGFAGFDTNADGRVSRDEFLAKPHFMPEPASIFDSRDDDGDGALTAAEFCAGWRAGCSMRMSEGHGPGEAGRGAARSPGMGMGPGRMGAGHGGGPRCEEHFARFDANADGSVTEAEFKALPHPHADAHEVFAARDLDHDGRLTRAEFCAPWSAPSTAQPAAP